MFNSKKAFTLTEILISTMVMGIVIALITPIFKDAGAEEKAIQLQFLTTYKNLHFAVKSLYLKNLDNDIDFQNICSNVIDRDKERCFTEGIQKPLSKSSNLKPNSIEFDSKINDIPANVSGILFLSGSAIFPVKVANECATLQEVLDNPNRKDEVCGKIFVDVNAKARPNFLGVDQFVIPIYRNGMPQPSMQGYNCGSFNNINDLYVSNCNQL